MLSKKQEARKKRAFLKRQASVWLDSSVRTWYMLGQRWFDLEGRIDDEVLTDLPEVHRGSVYMGFNAARWARAHNEPQSVRGMSPRIAEVTQSSVRWYD